MIRGWGFVVVAMVVVCTSLIAVDAAPVPLKILLVADVPDGEYGAHGPALKKALERYAHFNVTLVDWLVFNNENYGDGYDAVVHNHCHLQNISIDIVLHPHRNGTPGMIMHCLNHEYIGFAEWLTFIGITSNSHDYHAQNVHYVDTTDSVTRGLRDWVIPGDEEYNCLALQPTVTPVATIADARSADAPPTVAVWKNIYKGTRVFGTTFSHVATNFDIPDMAMILCRGLIWACNKPIADYMKVQALPVDPDPRSVSTRHSPGSLAAVVRVQGNRLSAVARGLPSDAAVELFTVSGTRVAACRLDDCTGGKTFMLKDAPRTFALARVGSGSFSFNVGVASTR